MSSSLNVFERLTITVEEAGRLLGVSRASAYRAAREGTLPAIRLGHRLVVPVEGLRTMLKSAGKGQPASNDGDGS
jgi:excisionase family DNA binding protein